MENYLAIFIPLAIAIVGGIYALLKRKRDLRLENDMSFEKLRTHEKSLVDSMAKIMSFNYEVISSHEKYVYQSAYNEYMSFYNEIEAFCTKVNDGTLKEDYYIKNTVLPVLKDYATLQINFYDTFSTVAEAINSRKPRGFGIGSYKEFFCLLLRYTNQQYVDNLKAEWKTHGVYF